MKKNNAGTDDVINITLTEETYSIAYKAKLEELIEQGMNEDEARWCISETSIQMELYYSKDQGLFMVESEAVESTTIYNPYSGDELEECEKDEENDSKIYCCPDCGSTDIQIEAWVLMNTNKYAGTNESDDAWCPKCKEHVEPITVEEFKTGVSMDEEDF